MHLLSEITIRNFKSIRSQTFELSAFTPLVGYNNAGKSNILESIKWLLKRSALTDSSFYDPAQPVEMEGKISGITQTILDQLPTNQQTAITPYLFTDSLYIKRSQAQPNTGSAGVTLYVRDPGNLGNANEWRTAPTGLPQALEVLFPEPIQIGAMEDSEDDISKSRSTTTIGKLLAEIIGPIQTGYTTHVQSALDGIR